MLLESQPYVAILRATTNPPHTSNRSLGDHLWDCPYTSYTINILIHPSFPIDNDKFIIDSNLWYSGSHLLPNVFQWGVSMAGHGLHYCITFVLGTDT